jgi:hypothetical protein
MILLLISAGFASLIHQEADSQVIADGVSVESDSVSPIKNTVSSQQKASNTAIHHEDDVSARVLAALKETEDKAFAQEAIFADETPAAKQAPPLKKVILDAEPLPKIAASKGGSAASANSRTTDTAPSEQVISSKNTPANAQTPVITGKLIIRSNVTDDTVLVNGKPYGPTKLELELTPGAYLIEVAKSGYQSWKANVDVRRGTTQTINANLEQFTKVSYKNGVWENGIKTGEGHYLEEGKLEYTGSFVNGKFHGSGSIRYANGMKYQGQWFEGRMQGKGTLTTTEGDTYVGEMNDNKFNGDGTLTKATGDIYTGFWIDGVLNGQGSLTTKGGLLYVGGFADNLFHGNGSLTYPDGGHYEGSFSNGMFHGKGVETYANGKKYVGQFIEGLYHGNGEILNPNGSKITGTFKDGKPFGKATLTTAEGEVFTARSTEPGVCYREKSYRATECPQLDGW